MVLIYWPIFLGHRFFWEDFFIQEYPIREYCFYMVRWAHQLPFWNPYSWAWSPLLADAQNGFWYPTNLLQIAVTWLFAPHAVHLPVIAPEVMTLLHLPLAALGMFVLARKQFRLSGIAALLAGLCWGFGVRMIAEQNHPMQIIQLALLPWEALLLMRSWSSWRYAIWLGLLFGISFLAGQPQTFFYIAIFLGAFTLAESVRRWRKEPSSWETFQPIVFSSLAIVIALCVSAIQLFPTLELVHLSARQHLAFNQASDVGLQFGHFINFFVPKFFGEYSGFGQSHTIALHNWYWEAAFYWGAIAEILAIFAFVSRWKERATDDPKSRYLFFFALFGILCLAYGMGNNLYFQWPFWKFLPFFDHIRAPNRMVWFVWFLGALLTGIGLDTLLERWNELQRYRRFFGISVALFLALNLLSVTGVFDYFFDNSTVRSGLWHLLLLSLLASLLAGLYFYLAITKRMNMRTAAIWAVVLVAADLYGNDCNWYRNTLNRETFVAQDSLSSTISEFRAQHAADHAKLLILRPEGERRMHYNLGMFLRLPIENAFDSSGLLFLNPLALPKALPPVNDPERRMEIMGVTTVDDRGNIIHLPQALPYLKLYRHWHIASGANAKELLNSPEFDCTHTILLDNQPTFRSATSETPDTAILESYSENDVKILVHAAQPEVLFVNDLWYPAWNARVDGNPVKILRAFTSLRAIPVAAGVHTVVLRYDSNAFNIGWKITAETILCALLALVFGPKQKSPGDNRGPSELK